MTGTETIASAEYIPLWVAIVTSLSGFGVALAQYVWSRQKAATEPKPTPTPHMPVSKEYERTMAVMMGRIAETLEAQTAILDKIERQLMVLLSRN